MPTFDVQPTHYAKAVGVALAVAVVGGILWGLGNMVLAILLRGILPAVLASVWAIPLGYFGGDLISRSVNRKRGNGLAWLAGGSVIVAYIINIQVFGFFFSLYGLIFLAVGVFLAIQHIRR